MVPDHLSITTLIFVCLLFTLSLSSFSFKSMQAFLTNKGKLTDYYFAFSPQNSYLTDMQVIIGFPIQYNLTAIASNLICYTSNQESTYSQRNCFVEPNLNLQKYLSLQLSYLSVGSIKISVPNITNSYNFNIVLKNILNPNIDSSSYFSICLQRGDVFLECDKLFGRVIFTSDYVNTTSNAAIETTPSPVVGQASTYIFTMNFSGNYSKYQNEPLEYRIVLPQNYTLDMPICSLVSYLNDIAQSYEQTTTATFPATQNIIRCRKIVNFSRYFDTNHQVTIKGENIINPYFSTNLTGFKVQLVRHNFNQLLEEITFSSNVEVTPEILICSIKQQNKMRNATNEYYFFINHELNYFQNSKISIQFQNDPNNIWDIHSGRLVHGFTQLNTDFNMTVRNSSYSEIIFQNYGDAYYQSQQILGVNLTSPTLIGVHKVYVTTYIDNLPVGHCQSSVQLNSTWGAMDLLSVSAVRSATKLPVDSTGPLQLTFFLNYQLPETEQVKNGSLSVTIIPQIPEPDPAIHGVIKCFFKGTLQAADCTYDNSDPTKTVVTLLSPPQDSFQYSQIPIIITTEGAIDTDHIGLTIDPLVQRYRFQCAFYLYNSSVIPSQVFYDTWIADAIAITSVTVHATSWEANQYTHLQLNLTTPLLDASTLQKQFRIMVQFLNIDQGAWHSTLGYNSGTIYKQYPCVVVGLPGTRIKCDLYTHSTTVQPHTNLHINSDLSGPYFLIYGFDQAVPTGSNVRIQIPRIKIGSSVGVPAKLGVSFLQQTPMQVEPFVQLYIQNLTAFTTLPPISMTEINVPSSQLPYVLIQSQNQYTINWNNVLQDTKVQYIMFQMSPAYLPSLITMDAVCQGSICIGAGLPANWIVQTTTLTSNTHLMNTLANYIKSMDYVPDLSSLFAIKMTTYDINGNTLNKYSMDIQYRAIPITTAFFDFLQTTNYYSGTSQWYSINFTNVDATVSAYPFVRFILNSDMMFTSPSQCSSTTFLAFNQSGIQCIIQDPQTMVVKNIQNLLPLNTYSINVKMQTTLNKHTATISPTVDIHVNHNYSVDASIVGQATDVPLVDGAILPILGQPAQFKIFNPQYKFEGARIGYIGPVYINFVSNQASTINVLIEFHNHRYNGGDWHSPTINNLDPLVCMNNQVRYQCEPINQKPLRINIYNLDIKLGDNQLRLDTEYIAPYNGIYHPDVAGQYPITITLINSTTNSNIQQTTFYTYIKPPALQHLQIGSIVKDIGTQSVYKVNFTLPNWFIYPKAYDDPSNYSRIYIQFPTEQAGVQVFEDNLGGYNGQAYQRVGCSFKVGAQYLVGGNSKLLQCRFIPQQHQNGPVKVQIINHQAFTSTKNSLSVYIFKVFNPILSMSSIPITVKIDHIQAATGHIYPLYDQTYTLFLHPMIKNPGPVDYPSVDSSSVQFFETGKDVGDYGAIKMKSHLVSGKPLLQPFFMIVKLPQYLIPQDKQIAQPFKSCPSNRFEQCVSSPQIGYLLLKTIFNQSIFQVYIKNYPISISLSDSMFSSMIIEQGRYTGNIIYTISANFRWQQIQGLLTYNYMEAVLLQQMVIKQKYNAEIVVSFTTTNYVPVGGTIEIGFPTIVTKIRPHCRSAVSNGSLLYAQAGASGQIGCQVQNANKWVITGFQEVLPGTTIIIHGSIDLPSISGSIGIGHITTYSNNDPNDIHLNGSRIDHLQTDFGLQVRDTLAMNVNPYILMSQRQPLRYNYVGQFRMLLKPLDSITKTGSISFRMYKNDIHGNTGGFSLNSRKKVCQVVRMDTNQHIGCLVISETSDIYAMSIVYTIQPTQTMFLSTIYQIRLTSQDYILPQGITFPTVPGLFKVDIIEYTSSAQTTPKIEQKYIQVYGDQFMYLKVTQYCYLFDQSNLLWIQISPTQQIQTTDQIIVQFPTLSNDQTTTMFLDDLGLVEIKDGDEIPFDIFSSPGLDNSYMQCRLFYGDSSRYTPARVICGNMLSALSPGGILKFALNIINPPAPAGKTQISLPILVYTYDPFYFKKKNFNLVNAAVYLTDINTVYSSNGFFATQSYQMQMPGDDLYLATKNSLDLLAGDSYVIKFNFPIRVTDMIVDGCKQPTNTTAFGDIYFHQNLRTMICKLKTTLPANPTPLSPNIMINGFYSYWYKLTDVERQVSAIATYHSTSTSEHINYYDLFPILLPRTTFTTLSYLELIPYINHMTSCQNDDYIIKVRLQAVGDLDTDLQYCKMISIGFPDPTLIDYNIINTDCIEHPLSQIEVISCRIDKDSRKVYVQIQPGIYTNDKMLVIRTKDLAIRNPCLNYSVSPIITYFTVDFYSWQNVTSTDAFSPDYAYMRMNASNIDPAFTPVYVLESITNQFHFNFEWIDNPYERYYSQFPQFGLSQYAPFAFDIYLGTALPTLGLGIYHSLTIKYGSNYIPKSYGKTNDLEYNKPVCFLHNTRVHRCTVDTINHLMKMEFSFGLPATPVNVNPIHAYFSVLDPRNPHINGFQYIGASQIGSIDIQLQRNGVPSPQIIVSYPIPVKQTHTNTPTPLPQRAITFAEINWANNLQNRLNVLDMTFYLNRSDITALVFEIPLRNQINDQIYGANKKGAFFNLNDGSQYPCGNNVPGDTTTGNPKCFIYHGDNSNLGIPTTITMVDFSYASSMTIKARLLLSNPDIVNVWFTVKVKAYAGVQNQDSIFGKNYVGYWIFPNIYQVQPDTSTTSAQTSNNIAPDYFVPNKGLWRDQTTWTLAPNSKNGISLGLNAYAIVQVTLKNFNLAYSDDQLCEVDFAVGQTSSDDFLILKSRQSNYWKGYFIKRFTSAVSWSINYMKCKHYGQPFQVYYNDPTKLIHEISTQYIGLNVYFQLYTPSLAFNYFVQSANKAYIQLDLSTVVNSVISNGLNWQHSVNYQLRIFISSGTIGGAIGTCYATGGFLNYLNKAVDCSSPSPSYIDIANFQQLVKNNRTGSYLVKVDFDMPAISHLQTTITIYTYLYANIDSLNGNIGYIFYALGSKTQDAVQFVRAAAPYSASRCWSHSASQIWSNTTYSYDLELNNLNILVTSWDISSTNLKLYFTVNPLAVNLNRNSYHENSYGVFKFVLNGLTINTCSYTRFRINTPAGTFNFLGTTKISCIISTASQNPGFILNTWSTHDLLNNFGFSGITSQSFSFQIEADITTPVNDPPNYRDWILMQAYWFYEQRYYYFTGCTAYVEVYYKAGDGQSILPYLGITQSTSIQTLSDNNDLPTELSFTAIQFDLSIGKSYAKYILLQFSFFANPFSYINDTSLPNQAIQCKCFTSPSSSFASSTFQSSPNCILKLPQPNFPRTAITIDIDVIKDQSLQCFFPQWKYFASFSSNIRLVNQFTSQQPTISTPSNGYGGMHSATTNVVSFNLRSTNPLSISQSNILYAAPIDVRTTTTASYILTGSFGGPLINKPFAYIDFQKGGPIMDKSSYCDSISTFDYCRVYNKIRQIIVAGYTLNSMSAITLSKSAGKILLYPYHKEPIDSVNDYNILIRVGQTGMNTFTYSGTYSRSINNLVTTKPSFFVKPQIATGNNIAGYTTNLIFSFNLNPHSLYFNQYGSHISIISSDSTLFAPHRGCTAMSVSNPIYDFDCQILDNGVQYQIRVVNREYTQNAFSFTGYIQIIAGITNPFASVVFTLKAYQYYYSSTNYGQTIQKTFTYTPRILSGTSMPQSIIRMYPFNTKIMSNTHSPFRTHFKLNNFPLSLADTYDYALGHKMILDGLSLLSINNHYQCLFKEYTTQPSSNPQSPLPNSYRNLKEGLQYTPLYVYCNQTSATSLQIEMPRIRPLSINYYYELIIMPVDIGLTQAGYNNIPSQYKLIAVNDPGVYSCQHIGFIYPYVPNSFTLTSIYVATVRPEFTTALEVHFSLGFSSSFDFPDHYLQIVFYDIDLNSIKPPYNVLGNQVPCTFTSLFQPVTGRITQPKCIINYLHELHQNLVLRVVNIGYLSSGSGYKLSLDDFLLPNLDSFLQQSDPFSICLRYYSEATNIHYQKCFRQILVIDDISNLHLLVTGSAIFHPPADTSYGVEVTSQMQLTSNYPMNSAGQIDQKMVMQVNGGYSGTNNAVINLNYYTLLWVNTKINFYVFKQTANSVNNPHNITISNIFNPEPYQKQDYEYLRSISLYYYDDLHPHTQFDFNQPLYSTFTINPSQVNLSATVINDIHPQSTMIPFKTSIMLKFTVLILQSKAALAAKKDTKFQIVFNSGVHMLQKCWAITNATGVTYESKSDCQTLSGNTIHLYHFYESNVDNNLTIYVMLKPSSSTLTYTSKVYSFNDEIQYNSTYSQTISKITLTQTLEPLLTFTQNHYTPYYFEQVVEPLAITTTTRELDFSLYLPSDLIYQQTIFTIYLPATKTIYPTNYTMQTKLVCQWLTLDKYGRQFQTGIYSFCSYVDPNIVVNAPYGGLLAFSGGSRIPYLLRIRQIDPITTRFTMPSTALAEQIKFQTNNNNVFEWDTIIIHPFNKFPSGNLKLQHTTMTTSELNTYLIQFTPTIALVPGQQMVLQLSIQNRYMQFDLGMTQLFLNQGRAQNLSRIDNLQYNVVYDVIPNKWVNGIPYTCYTNTGSLPIQTSIHQSSSSEKIRITHLLQTAYAAGSTYIWKIPLIKNPNTDGMPIRSNLTLINYMPGSTIGQYQLFSEIINQYKTAPSVIGILNYSLIHQNTIQNSPSNLSVQFSSLRSTPNITQRVELLYKNNEVGMIDFSFGLQATIPLASPDPSYQFWFFPRLNLIIAEKLVTDSSLVLNTGTNDLSNFYSDYWGYKWAKIHQSLPTPSTILIGGQKKTLVNFCTLATSFSFNVVEGIQDTQYSSFLLSIVIVNPCIIQKNSTYVIQFDSTHYESITGTPCYTSFRYSQCSYKDSVGQVEVRFLQEISVNNNVLVEIYLKAIGTLANLYTFDGYIYGIPHILTTKIIDIGQLGQLTVLSSPGKIVTANHKEFIVMPIYELSQMDIRGTFTVNYLPFQTLTFENPFIGSLLADQRFLYRINQTGVNYTKDFELNWVQTYIDVLTPSSTKSTVPFDGTQLHAIKTSVEYSFILQSTYQPNFINNYTTGAVGSYYQFQYLTQSQYEYFQVYTVPVAQPVTIINPLTEVGFETAIGLQFSITNHSMNNGDRLHIQLDTTNLLYPMYHSFNGTVQCVQRNPGIISPLPSLLCEFTKYPTSTIPAIITVYPSNTVSANTQMQIWISPIFNPLEIMVTGVTITLDKDCAGSKRCVVYEGRGYYRSTQALILNDNLIGTFTPSNTEVLKTNVQHIYVLNNSQTYTSAFLSYPQNYQHVMSLSCSQISGFDCLIFPNQRRVLTIIPSVLTDTFTLAGMTNGIYIYPQMQNIVVTAVSTTAVNRHYIPHNNLTTLQHTLTLSTETPTSMTIIPTQTPGYFLRNQMNTVLIQIFGLYSNEFVNCFYINAPKQIVTWDNTYCNATMESSDHNPYPTRLQCSYINQTTIQIMIPEGVSYVPTVSENYFLNVHAKFKIEDFGPADGILYVSPPVISGTFNAYGSHSVSNHSYPYYITQAMTTIVISEHKVPIIGDTNFNTQSYEQRLAHVNQNTTFQLLIDPKTDETIDRIDLILPEQFGYPPIGNHNACSLLGSQLVKLGSCYEIRKDNKTILSIKLDPTYDNGPRILKLGSSNMSQWFIAPPDPGFWYNLTVSLYAPNGTLLQQQTTKNMSQIGGIDFYRPNMTILNGRDQYQRQIFDLSFVTGSLDVYQGYSTNLTYGKAYTQIQIAFQNGQGYDFDLGMLNLTNGDLVGCVTNLKAIQQVKCSLRLGKLLRDEPAIIITGYEYIPKYTNVTISLSNIKNLIRAVSSTLSVAITMKRVQHFGQAYLYNPTFITILSTSPLNTVAPPTLTITYGNNRIVNSPASILITLKPSVDITDYIVLKFPVQLLSKVYQNFKTNCALASKVQVFYYSGIIRFYPLTIHSANTQITYNITDFPSAEYAISQYTFNVTFQAYSNLKQVNSANFTITNLTIFTCNFDKFILLSMSSPYTYDNQVSYVFEFWINSTKLGSEQITITIMFPPAYGNLSSNQVNCTVEAQPGLLCQVKRNSYLQIVAINNTNWYSTTSHKVRVQSLTNPSNANLNNNFTITSFLSSNIDKAICSGITSNKLLLTSPNECILSMQSLHTTTKYLNEYTFTMLCPRTLRNNSDIYVKIPPQYIYNNPISSIYPCWLINSENSANTASNSEECSIRYINGSYFMIMEKVQIQNNEISLSLRVRMNNPIQSLIYNFSMQTFVDDFPYAFTENVTYKPLNSSQSIQNNQIQLTNMPKQAGTEAYYIFRVPTSSLADKMNIDFPNQFQLNGQDIIVQKYVSNSSTWAQQNYLSLLNSTKELETLQSKVTTEYNFENRINLLNTANHSSDQGQWTYIIIHPVLNPPYATNRNFTLMSYNESLTSNEFKSYFTGPLVLNSSQNLNYNNISLSYSVQNPPVSIRHIKSTVGDNDILQFTDYNLTYILDGALYTNKSTLIVTIPEFSKISLYALLSVQCCLTYQNTSVYCTSCSIGNSELIMNLTDGLDIPADSEFILSLKNIYNPPNITTCTVLTDFINTYYKLQILRDYKLITHQTSSPTSMDYSPCIIYRNTKADIIPILPDILYVGFVYTLNLQISQPTKFLRIILNSTLPSGLSFIPERAYFENYNGTMQNVSVVVSPTAVLGPQYINITHQQAALYDLFRPNLPMKVTILNNHSQTIQIQQAEYPSAGQYIQFPITLSKTTSTNLSIQINTTPNDPLLIFQNNPIVIQSMQNSSILRVKYNGQTIPSTFTLNLSIVSQYNSPYVLSPQTVYLVFGIDKSYQLYNPPIMNMKLSHRYFSNAIDVNKTVYLTNVTQKSYEVIKPKIINHTDYKIGSTYAQIKMSTLRESSIYYYIVEEGDQYKLTPQSSLEIKQNKTGLSKKVQTYRNSSKIINAYQLLNFSALDAQTTYHIFAMASDTLGISDDFIEHIFKTQPLSTAIELDLYFSSIQTNQVDIVRALSSILEIDITRIMVTSSEKILARSYSLTNYTNKPLFKHTIVISPSTTNDVVSSYQTVQKKLINSTTGQAMLKQLLPYWVQSNKTLSQSFKNLNRMRPILQQPPKVVKISYYNATFNVSYWNKARVYAVLLETVGTAPETLTMALQKIVGRKVNQSDQNPNSKQIMHGKNRYNQIVRLNFSNLTNQNGSCTIIIQKLKPGSNYTMFVTASTPEVYQPRILLEQSEITIVKFATFWNPNLRNHSAVELEQLKQLKPQLYEALNQFYQSKNKRLKVSSR